MSRDAQRVTLQPAYVLHHYPYRDSSRLLELTTRDYGRVGLVARGLRSPRSRLRGVVQPFRPLLVSWISRSDLGTMTAAELDAGTALPAQQLMSGWYMNELLLRLTRRHDAHPDLFRDYGSALQALGSGVRAAAVLRIFEKRLLDALGYGIDLNHDAEGQPLHPARRYAYKSELGLVPGSANDKTLTFSGKSLLALASEAVLDGEELHDARLLLTETLALYLGPRPLKVREVSRAVARRP